jgi:hypothetical protein
MWLVCLFAFLNVFFLFVILVFLAARLLYVSQFGRDLKSQVALQRIDPFDVLSNM